GDIVKTTGQDAIYPPGYNVGEVVEVKSGSATQTQLIHVRPGAGLERLKEVRSEEHTSELQSRFDLVCRLLLEKKNKIDVIFRKKQTLHRMFIAVLKNTRILA